MVHRLALLMGGAGAAGVLALALALGGFGAPVSNPDAFVPVANKGLGGGLLPAAASAGQQTLSASLGGGQPERTDKKVIDTVYVLPAPATVHAGKPATNSDEPADTPRPHTNGGNNAGDSSGDDQGEDEATEDPGDDQSGDEAGEDDHSNDGDHSDDGGSDDGGSEPGDD